jgi:hypothetical protein
MEGDLLKLRGTSDYTQEDYYGCFPNGSSILERNISTGFHCPSPFFYRARSVQIAKVELRGVEIDGDSLKVEFLSEVPSSVSAISEPNSGTVTMKTSDWAKIPHELVSYGTFGVSDVPFRSIFGNFDRFDNKTPDFLALMGEVYVCVEIKTTNRESLVSKKFDESLGQYSEALHNRSDSFPNINYFGLSVSLGCIVSNLKLSISEVNEIVSLYNLGVSILESIRALGVEFPEQEEMGSSGEMLKVLNSPFKLPDDKAPIISEKIYESFLVAQPNHEENFKIFVNLAKRQAQKEISYYSKKFQRSQEIRDGKSCRTLLSEKCENHLAKFLSGRDPDAVLSNKAVVQYPVAIPYAKKADLETIMPLLGETPLCTVWRSALGQALSFEENYLTKSTLDAPKENRFRVQLSLDESERIYLSEFGVEGRSFEKEYGKESKSLSERTKGKTISWDSDLSDISDFLANAKSYLNTVSTPRDDTLEKVHKLVEKFAIDPSSIQDDRMRELKSMRIVSALRLLSDISEEMNYSLSQNCSQGEFILKIFKDSSVCVLAKPTNKRRGIRFSALILSDDVLPLPFKQPSYSFKNLHIYDFLFLDEHKISNTLACDLKAILLKLTSEISTNGSVGKVTVQSDKHFLMSLLIYLEDKEKTAADLSLIRYSYMSCASGSEVDQDPLKVLSKMTKFPKSRLLLFCQKRVIECFSLFGGLSDSGETDNDDVSKDNFKGLLSWVDLNPIKRFETCLYLSYMSQVHNKDEGSEFHGYFQIFNKVISEQIKMRKVREENMWRNSETDLKSHEFNSNFVAGMSANMKVLLDKQKGCFHTFCKTEIMRKLSRESIFKFATTKASAVITENQWYSPDERINGRRKCLEAVREVIDVLDMTDESVFLNLEKIFQIVEERGGVWANLFKKLQITGVREIFILDIFSRILVNFFESLVRSTCEIVPSEMLSKGTTKMKRGDSHFKEVSRLAGSKKVISSSDASDATTWCQQFVMTSFGLMATVLYPPEISKPFCRMLNLITRKKLELPKALLDKMTSLPDQPLYNSEMTELRDQFLGRSEHSDLIDEGKIFMKNNCNMMQGILHFTSSLYHSCLCEYTRNMSITVLSDLLKAKVVITDRISSDDSSRDISVIGGDPGLSDKKKQIVMRAVSLASADCYPLANALDSVKSARFILNGIREFNSVWTMKNTLLGIHLKFAWPSLLMPCVPNLDARQDFMSNARQSMIENGCGTLFTSQVQTLQMEYYYICLGMRSQSSFRDFLSRLEKNPHHSLGLFLIEPPVSCGIAGVQVCKYELYKSLKPKAIEELFRTSKLVECYEDGAVSTGNLSFGEGKRFLRLRENLGFSNDALEQEIERDPSIIFRRAQTREELLTKLNFLTSSPSIGNSLMFHSQSKLHSSSVYILNSECLTISESETVEGKTTSVIKKVSLNGFLNLISEKVKERVKSGMVDVDQRDWFPNRLFLELCISTSSDFFYKSEISPRTALRSVIFERPKSYSSLVLDLKTTMTEVWFGISSGRSKFEVDLSFASHKKESPWLRDTFEESFEKSPFLTKLSLLRFILKEKKMSSKVSVITSSKRCADNRSLVTELFEFSAGRGLRWRRRTESRNEEFPALDINMDEILIRSSRVMTLLWRAASGPYTDVGSRAMMEILKTSPIFSSPEEALVTRSVMEAHVFEMSVMQSYAVNPKFNVSKVIKESGIGVMAFWTSEQKMNPKTQKFYGAGQFVLNVGSLVIFNLDSQGKLTILTDELSNITNNSSSVKTAYERMGSPAPSRSHLGVSRWLDTVRMTLSHKSVGIPVIIKNQSDIRINPRRLSVVCSRGKIELSDGRTTVLSVRPRPTRINVPFAKEEIVMNTIEEHWLKNIPLPLDFVFNFRKTRFGNSLSSFKAEAFDRDWLKKTFLGKVRTMGIDRISALASVLEDNEVFSEEEDQKAPGDIDISSLKMEEILGAFWEPNPSEEEVDDGLSGIGNVFFQQEANLKDDMFSFKEILVDAGREFYRESRFWDTVIEECKNRSRTFLSAIINSDPTLVGDSVGLQEFFCYIYPL